VATEAGNPAGSVTVWFAKRPSGFPTIPTGTCDATTVVTPPAVVPASKRALNKFRVFCAVPNCGAANPAKEAKFCPEADTNLNGSVENIIRWLASLPNVTLPWANAPTANPQIANIASVFFIVVFVSE
jgi:hypothetical protein